MSSPPGMYDQVINEIIRPPKLRYTDYDLPYDEAFEKVMTVRTDFKVMNNESNKLSCSVYHEEGQLMQPRDFVIYCHTREGNRLQGLFLRRHFLPHTNVVIFDFCGCGNSETDYVTLGIKEANDIASVIKHIREHFRPRNIALWGRSMGAGSSIIFSAVPENQQFVSCLVLDSPFTTLKKLAEDIVKSRRYVPSFLIRCGLCCVRSDLKKQTGVDIGGIKNYKAVEEIDVPALYISAKEDQVVLPKRVATLFEHHKSKQKQFLSIEGDHACEREEKDMAAAAKFVKAHLAQPQKIPSVHLSFRDLTKVDPSTQF